MVNKQFGKLLFGTVILIVFWCIIIMSIDEFGFMETILPFVIMIGLTGALIYGFISNLFLNMLKSDEKYYVTNKRLIIIVKNNDK